jgi:hypothetical protein
MLASAAAVAAAVLKLPPAAPLWDAPAGAAAGAWMLRCTDACCNSNRVLMTQIGFVMKHTCAPRHCLSSDPFTCPIPTGVGIKKLLSNMKHSRGFHVHEALMTHVNMQGHIQYGQGKVMSTLAR